MKMTCARNYIELKKEGKKKKLFFELRSQTPNTLFC